ncbi:uncharacterized protein LOC125508233 isoform X2 [Triticum urartu]|uniref:uncharacterized protein LOC125508233 isoform X2 n=1 Tax=Triticum urartu TaxID=4572 RepID=UPI002044B4FA|nr:uncharacterized protein LOC125508233 isoform X2 [Triticum urartu]
MPRKLRALRKSHALAGAAPNADLVRILSARVSTPAQTLASVATQGRDDAEKRRVVGVVVGKGCLKRSVGGASGGGSGSSKKDCAGAEEQVAEVIVRKGCLKHPGADASSGSSSAAKKVRFVLVEQAEAEMVGFRRPRVTWSPVVAKTRGRQKARVTLAGAKSSGGERRRTSVDGDSDGEGADAGGAGSDAQLRLFKRNVGNFGTGDGVEKVAGAASRNTTSKADMEDGDVETVDRKRKASENTEDIGYVWLMPNIPITNLSQILSATKGVANKMATKIVANFSKKLSR